MGHGLRILFAAPAWWPGDGVRRPGGGGEGADDAPRRARSLGRGGDDEPQRPRSARRLALADRRARRRARPLSRHAGPLPLDGHHADAAARARRGSSGRTSCTCSASATRSRRPPPPGPACGAIPYVFEPLGMFRPRLRKVALKQALDSTLYRGVASGAAAVVVSSSLERRRRRRPPASSRPSGSTCAATASRSRSRRPRRAGPARDPGRRARDPVRRADRGREGDRAPRSRCSASCRKRTSCSSGRTIATASPRRSAVTACTSSARPTAHRSTSTGWRTCSCCRQPERASAWSLPRRRRPERRSSSRTDAASPASSSKARRWSCRTTRPAIVDAVRSVLADPVLRARLAAGGVAAARRSSWEAVTDRQEELYRLAVASRTASSRFVDRRFVAEALRELARARAHPQAQVTIGSEAA